MQKLHIVKTYTTCIHMRKSPSQPADTYVLFSIKGKNWVKKDNKNH